MVSVRASVAQCCSVGYDVEKTLQKMERLVKVAVDRDQSQLVVFPEAFLGGYPKGLTFGCTVGERAPSGREDFLAYSQSAIEVPGPVIKRIEDIAKEHQVFIVSGVIEREGGTLYCSVVWVDPVLGLVDSRRKLMPTASERLIWGQGSASDVKLVTITLHDMSLPLKISATICWENYMPLLRQRLYDLGAMIYCAPTVDGRDVWQSTMTHIALEGRCFVLSACQMSEKDHVGSVEAVKADDRDEQVKIAGGSVIIDPLGDILAGPLRGREDVLTATLDMDTIARGKFDLDVSGHYARKDIFKLSVAS